MRAARNVVSGMSTVGELFQFLSGAPTVVADPLCRRPARYRRRAHRGAGHRRRAIHLHAVLMARRAGSEGAAPKVSLTAGAFLVALGLLLALLLVEGGLRRGGVRIPLDAGRPVRMAGSADDSVPLRRRPGPLLGDPRLPGEAPCGAPHPPGRRLHGRFLHGVRHLSGADDRDARGAARQHRHGHPRRGGRLDVGTGTRAAAARRHPAPPTGRRDLYGWNDHWIALGPTDRALRRVRPFLWLAEHARIVQAVLKARVGASASARDRPNRVPPDEYRENLQNMATLAHQSGITPVFVTAPSNHVPGHEPEYLLRRHVRRLADVVPLHLQYAQLTAGRCGSRRGSTLRCRISVCRTAGSITTSISRPTASISPTRAIDSSPPSSAAASQVPAADDASGSGSPQLRRRGRKRQMRSNVRCECRRLPTDP